MIYKDATAAGDVIDVRVSAMRVYFTHANAVGLPVVTDDAAPVDRDFVIAIAPKQLQRMRSFGSDPTNKGE